MTDTNRRSREHDLPPSLSIPRCWRVKRSAEIFKNNGRGSLVALIKPVGGREYPRGASRHREPCAALRSSIEFAPSIIRNATSSSKAYTFVSGRAYMTDIVFPRGREETVAADGRTSIIKSREIISIADSRPYRAKTSRLRFTAFIRAFIKSFLYSRIPYS